MPHSAKVVSYLSANPPRNGSSNITSYRTSDELGANNTKMRDGIKLQSLQKSLKTEKPPTKLLLPSWIPIIVPLSPNGTATFSLTLTTRSNSSNVASLSGRTAP